MIRLGVTENGHIKVITDGTIIYEIDNAYIHESIYCEIASVKRGGKGYGPVVYTSRFGGYVNEERARKMERIKKVNIPIDAFEKYCASRGLMVKTCSTIPKGIISWVGNIAGSYKFDPTDSRFFHRDCEHLFRNSKAVAEQWEALDIAEATIRDEDKRKYAEHAKKRWFKFFRLQGLNNIDSMSGGEFESAIALLYERNGYKVQLTPSSGDFGVDVIVEKRGRKTVIQAKRYVKSVGVRAVQEISAGANFYKSDHAIVITSSSFTDQAKILAERISVELIDRNKLLTMWANTHKYENIAPFDLHEYEKIKDQIDRIIGK